MRSQAQQEEDDFEAAIRLSILEAEEHSRRLQKDQQDSFSSAAASALSQSHVSASQSDSWEMELEAARQREQQVRSGQLFTTLGEIFSSALLHRLFYLLRSHNSKLLPKWISFKSIQHHWRQRQSFLWLRQLRYQLRNSCQIFHLDLLHSHAWEPFLLSVEAVIRSPATAPQHPCPWTLLVPVHLPPLLLTFLVVALAPGWIHLNFTSESSTLRASGIKSGSVNNKKGVKHSLMPPLPLPLHLPPRSARLSCRGNASWLSDSNLCRV